MKRLILVALLAFGLPAAADSWEELRGLHPGDSLRVTDTAGAEQKARFVAATADSLSIETSKGQVAMDRARVRKVELRSGARRARNAAIGAAIGVALGVAVDQTLGTRLRNEGNYSSQALSYVVPIGGFAAIGALMPSYRTVYRAP